jgi:hypothetical protein
VVSIIADRHEENRQNEPRLRTHTRGEKNLRTRATKNAARLRRTKVSGLYRERSKIGVELLLAGLNGDADCCRDGKTSCLPLGFVQTGHGVGGLGAGFTSRIK